MIKELYEIAYNYQQREELELWVRKYVKRLSTDYLVDTRYLKTNKEIMEHIDRKCKAQLCDVLTTTKSVERLDCGLDLLPDDCPDKYVDMLRIRHELLILNDETKMEVKNGNKDSSGIK